MQNNDLQDLEIVGRPAPAQPIRAAFFDFDGTISRIVEGWQQIILTMFHEILDPLPGGEMPDDERLMEIIDLNTGKRTISQAHSMVEEIRRRGGEPLAAEEYLTEYLRRLDGITGPRVAALRAGESKENYLMPGVRQCLEMLRRHNIPICLASGSDLQTVLENAELLGIREFFNGGIFGTLGLGEGFDKAIVLGDFLSRYGLPGESVVGFGDGHIETRDVRRVGGLAVGVAFNEKTQQGFDLRRRDRLVAAGADWIIADFSVTAALEARLFGK